MAYGHSQIRGYSRTSNNHIWRYGKEMADMYLIEYRYTINTWNWALAHSQKEGGLDYELIWIYLDVCLNYAYSHRWSCVFYNSRPQSNKAELNNLYHSCLNNPALHFILNE